jgi:hypothetical protein
MKDKAIEEIRQVRRDISKQSNHDIKQLVKHYQELEKKHKERMLKNPHHSIDTR